MCICVCEMHHYHDYARPNMQNNEISTRKLNAKEAKYFTMSFFTQEFSNFAMYSDLVNNNYSSVYGHAYMQISTIQLRCVLLSC